MDKEKIKYITETFFQHPEWKLVIELIEEYIKPMDSIHSVDTKGKTSDEVFAIIKGRQEATGTLRDFIKDSLTLAKKVSLNKTHKYK